MTYMYKRDIVEYRAIDQLIIIFHHHGYDNEEFIRLVYLGIHRGFQITNHI